MTERDRTIRVRVDFEWNEYGRRALAHRIGRHGRLATAAECRLDSWMSGISNGDDLSAEYEACEEGCHADRRA